MTSIRFFGGLAAAGFVATFAGGCLTKVAEVCSVAADRCGELDDGGAEGGGGFADGAVDAPGEEASFDGSPDRGMTGDTSIDAAFDAPPLCDTSKSPKEDDCVIDDTLAVFVNGLSGVDSNDGTKGAPLKSIGAAVGKLSGRNRVYVCATTYTAPLTLTATSNGVSYWGGFDCATWTYLTAKARVAPGAKGYALEVTGAVGVLFEDFDFAALAGSAAGESSVGAFVSGSTGIVLRGTKITAGAGVAGAAGTAQSNYSALASSDPKIKGKSTATAAGAGPQLCDAVCTNGVKSRGGSGGAGGTSAGVSGQDGEPAVSQASPPAATGTKGTGQPSAIGVCTAGTRGSDAPEGSGGGGATSNGSLSVAGWANASASGANGGFGTPGQGGGGGGGGVSPADEGGGGGGGCGGCGGAGATGGKAGGSSIALAVVASSMTLDACTLVTANAGKGGDGSSGQAGQTGGFAGAGSIPGCNGGSGGTGGRGGGGGGGAGGLSVGVLYSGTAPTLTGSTSQLGALGLGGSGGTGGIPAATKGKDGVAAQLLAAP